MSLRLRLFLGLSGLVAALVAAQLWWVRALARDLTHEVGQVAFEVGHSVATVITHESDCPPGAECDVFIKALEPPHAVFFHSRQDGAAGPETAPAPSAAGFQWVTAEPDEDGPAEGIGGESTAPSGGIGGERTSKTRFKVVRRVLAGEPHELHLRLHTEAKAAAEGDKTAAAFLSVSSDDMFERRIRIPEEGLHARFEDYERRLLLGALGLLGGGLLLAGVVAQRVSAPLRRLTEAAREVGHGAFGARVTVAGGGEVGAAIHAFNRMSGELAALDERARSLEARRHLGEIGDIARGLAHTLRNPLNALGLSVEELASRAAGGDELAAAARRQIRRIDASIRSFLALASQGGGAAEDVAPAELAQDVALEALQDARGRVRLAVDADPATPSVAAVEPELRAVLQALLVNAVEASPEGGTVRIRVAPAGPSTSGAQRPLGGRGGDLQRPLGGRGEICSAPWGAGGRSAAPPGGPGGRSAARARGDRGRGAGPAARGARPALHASPDDQGQRLGHGPLPCPPHRQHPLRRHSRAPRERRRRRTSGARIRSAAAGRRGPGRR